MVEVENLKEYELLHVLVVEDSLVEVDNMVMIDKLSHLWEQEASCGDSLFFHLALDKFDLDLNVFETLEEEVEVLLGVVVLF